MPDDEWDVEEGIIARTLVETLLALDIVLHVALVQRVDEVVQSRARELCRTKYVCANMCADMWANV